MKALTFGELMLRLKPPDHTRILQTSSYEATYGGAEANVAVSLALQGDETAYLTKLPNNPLGEAALGALRRYGVDTSRVLRGGPRIGIYFFEKGSDIRPTSVVYDRAGSSVASASHREFDWPAILEGIGVFYFSGVTPAVSDELAAALEEGLVCCRELGVRVVCDLNYRGKLWSPEKARSVMGRLMRYVDVCIANDEDFESSLGIRAFDGDLSHGLEQIEEYRAGMAEIMRQYPNCTMVASILRNVYDVERGDWKAIVLSGGRYYESPVRSVRAVEGVGAGDAFGAGILHCLMHGFGPQETAEYSLAASVLKLMIPGDQNLVSEAEIRAQMKKSGGSRLSR